MEKVQIKILGISEVKSSQDIYWLLLEEVLGERRVPILIGKIEAQSISASLQNIEISVPLPHDLIAKITDNFNIKLKDVLIFSKEEGLFLAQQTWQKRNNVFIIESRASDGIALALRCNTPIFIDSAILDQVEEVVISNKNTHDANIQKLSPKTLKQLLEQAIENENYEQAAQIRDELKTRKKQK